MILRLTKNPEVVIPELLVYKQYRESSHSLNPLDSRFRGNDAGVFSRFVKQQSFTILLIHCF